MQLEVSGAVKARFGVFEADLKTGELRRSGLRVRLQAQPFRVLKLLLENAGEIVTREDLQLRVWGAGTNVDFEHSLGTAINKIREALSDSAENPRFVETLSRRGYRFIAPVSFDDGMPASSLRVAAGALEESARIGTSERAASAQVEHRRLGRLSAILVPALLLLVAIGFWIDALVIRRSVAPLHVFHLTFSGKVSPGDTFLESLPATATDGARIYFSELVNGRQRLAQALIANGNTNSLTLPDEIIDPLISDISPDGSRLIIRNHLAAEIEQTLWIVPTLGGAARQIPGILAHDATWMPDGRRILYASGNSLWIADENGSNRHLFAQLPGRPFWLRWSPNANSVRMTLLNPANHTTALWEGDSSGTHFQPLLPGWSQPGSECCGSWTADGKDYVFESSKDAGSNIWLLGHGGGPIQLTSGPLDYRAPITSRSGRQIFFVGADTRSELLEFSRKTNRFVSYGDTLSTAHRVVFSRDGKWMAWVSLEESSLWRSRVNGTERIQLTSPPVEVFMMNWSPDGQKLVFMAREPGKLWQIESIDSDGGNLHPLYPENRNQADPDWSPDGKSIVFGRVPLLMGETGQSRSLYVLDLANHRVQTIPGSDGLFSPRWSPDGRFIAALSLDMNRLMLYDTTTNTWRRLAQHSVADPVWAHDSRSIFFHDYVQKNETMYRITVPEGNIEQVADLEDIQYADAVDYQFAGLTPDDTPLVSARMSTADIYSAQLPK